MKNNKLYWIRKYVVILFFFFITETIISVLFSTFLQSTTMETMNEMATRITLYSLSFYIAGIIVAIIVYYDIRALRIEAKYTVLCTAVFAPFGVCLFLLYVILSEINKSETPQIASQQS
jgi:cytochrome bd-type quinol oxidase subunit 2